MMIEIRWRRRQEDDNFKELSARYLLSLIPAGGVEAIGVFAGKLEVLATHPMSYEAVGCHALNWCQNQTRFGGWLLPWFWAHGCEDAAIYIDNQTLGAWAADQDGQSIRVQELLTTAVKDLKATRRFLRDKRVEAVRKDLEHALGFGRWSRRTIS